MPAPTPPTGASYKAAPYLSEYLIEAIRRAARLPLTDATFETWELLAMADEQIAGYLAPFVLGLAEDHLTAYSDTVITSSDTYRPPARAMKLREVQFLKDGKPYDVPRIALEAVPYADWGFYFVGNTLRLVNPSSFVGVTLRQHYHLRPSKLIASSGAGYVSSVDRGTGVVTLATTSPVVSGTYVDLVRGVPPFEVMAADVLASPVNVNDVTLPAASIPAAWGEAGDIVVRAGESPAPQIPADLFALLAQSVAVKILDGNGESDAYERAKVEKEQLEASARVLVQARVEGEPLALGGGFDPIWDRGWT